MKLARTIQNRSRAVRSMFRNSSYNVCCAAYCTDCKMGMICAAAAIHLITGKPLRFNFFSSCFWRKAFICFFTANSANCPCTASST